MLRFGQYPNQETGSIEKNKDSSKPRLLLYPEHVHNQAQYIC